MIKLHSKSDMNKRNGYVFREIRNTLTPLVGGCIVTVARRNVFRRSEAGGPVCGQDETQDFLPIERAAECRANGRNCKQLPGDIRGELK
jgi:hypothetical protein